MIPDGTVVSCKAWIRNDRSDGETTGFQLLLDDVPCGQRDLTLNDDSGWYQIGMDEMTVLGDDHQLKMVVVNTRGPGNMDGMGFALDDFELGPVRGPGTTCGPWFSTVNNCYCP